MKVTVPEISFHNRDPVLSVDVQHNSPDDVIRMATGGTDTHVIVWQLNPLPTGGVGVEVLCDLVRHNRSVNAVRFSPDGTLLASADDEAAIIVWKKQEAYSSAAPDLFASEGEERNKENWTIYKMLRGHIEDVYDLSWSSCSNFLISGSIDNSAIMWDVHKAKNIGLLKEHKNFVQGVAWDPLGQFVATLSSDRVLRWFSVSTKRALHRVSKAELPVTLSSSNTSTINTRLFFDDTLKSFCRRLAFSPDGMLLAAPAGILEGEQLGPRFLNAVHVFTRLSPDKPAIYLPTRDKYSLAVRFCPLLFKLRAGRKKSPYHGQSVFALPYRMVFAVACQNSVLLYDTQQLMPFAMVSNMHITRLTDLSWSSDGRILAISSTDGYCSITYFNEGELGEVYSPNPEARCTPLKKNVLNDSNSLPTPEEKGCLEDNIVDEKCIEETKNKKLPGEKTNVSSPNVEKEENALVVSKTELRLEDNVKVVNLTLEKENKVDASNVSISEKNKSRVSVLTAKKGHKNATTSPSKNKFCAELARDSMPENDEPRTSSQENCNAVPLNNEKDVQREDKDTIESDDCESIGSKDSESDEDDDDISLMSCDTDDDAKEKLSDEDMEATEIVFSNIKNCESESLAPNAGNMDGSKCGKKPTAVTGSSLVEGENVESKTQKEKPCPASVKPSNARRVNLITIKRNPKESSSNNSTSSTGASAGARPPRRVALVSLPSSSKKQASGNLSFTAADSFTKPTTSVAISDNTSDLCLMLEDESTAYNPAEEPRNSKSSGTADTKTKIDLHSALMSSVEKNGDRGDLGSKSSGDACLPPNQNEEVKAISSCNSTLNDTTTSDVKESPGQEISKSITTTSPVDASSVPADGGTQPPAAAPAISATKTTPRTPRRVSLITLSSPKAKKCLNPDRNKPV